MLGLLAGCGQPAPDVSVDELPYSDEVVYDEPFALINENNAFLSAAGDNDTLILSNKPYMWKLEKGEEGSHIVSASKENLMFDLDNADYTEGNRVHLFEDTGYPCQYWNLTEAGSGWIITSAEKPEWSVISAEEGFTLGKTDRTGKNDTWKIVKDGDWKKSFVSSAEKPISKESFSYTPTPEFWEKYDAEGLDGLRSYDAGSGEIYAQYAEAFPVYDGPENNFDFFSVDFCTDSQPDFTYWSLANWGMDSSEYMKRNKYTGADSVGAYGGLQDVGDHTTKIMSFWEMYFSKNDGSTDTLVPECLYPEGGSSGFDNEGSGISLVAPFEWKENTWYRYVLRTWEHEDTTYAGSWIEDLSTGEVTLLAVYDTKLPKSSITGVPSQFLENYSPETHGEYRQMQLKNYCLRSSDSGEWIFPDEVNLAIWAELELDNRGSYRFSAEGDTITLETCGLGEDVCKGMSDADTEYLVNITPAASAPDESRYEIPEL